MDENMFDLGLDVASISVEIPDPVITLTGLDNYTVPNTADYPLLALSVYGKSTQDTSISNLPAGKNLFNLLQATTSNNNIVVNENSITFPKATGIYRVTIDNYVLEVGKTYTFSAKASQITTLGWELVYADWNSAYLESVGSEIKRTFTIEKEVTKIILYIRHDDATASVTVSNPQIELGSTATSYEPYKGTPTPDAPIPIESVGDDGNVGVTACGKNLFNFNAFKNDVTGQTGNTTITWPENGISIAEADAHGYPIFGSGGSYGFKIDAEPLTEYTLSWISSETDGFMYVYSNATPPTLKLVEASAGKVTFTTPSDTEFISILPVSYNGTVAFSNIQLGLGSTATAYEPYTGNTATITSGLPLCSVGKYRDELIYNADGTGKIIKRIRKAVLDGSESNWIMYTTSNQKNRPSLNLGEHLCIFGDYTTTSPSLIMCDKYKATTYSEVSGDNEGIALYHVNGNYLSIYDEEFATATIDEWKTHLATNPITVIYVLNTPQEIELTAAEMTKIKQLQSYKGTTNLYNDEQAEMLVKMLRSDYDMKYIEWLKESQTWVCPKAGKWKVICVGGGASGGKYDVTSESAVLTATVAGGTTSFGSVIAANGAPSTTDYSIYAHTATDIGISGYGGYNGIVMGGVPSYGTSRISSGTIANGGGNAAAMSCGNPTAAIGYGAGGGAVAHEDKIYLIAGRAGSIESTIVDLEEGQAIMCTIGKGGQTTDAKTMGNGADGVIVVQYLGY